LPKPHTLDGGIRRLAAMTAKGAALRRGLSTVTTEIGCPRTQICRGRTPGDRVHFTSTRRVIVYLSAPEATRIVRSH
jgi:hypothetical protein